MHAAKRDGSGGEADVRGLAGYFQRLGQRFDRRRRNEADRASLPIAADDRAVQLPEASKNASIFASPSALTTSDDGTTSVRSDWG